MFRRVRSHVALLPLCLTLLIVSCSTPDAAQTLPEPLVSAQATLPNGFTDTPLVSVAKPTALAFSSDGQTLLITTQPGLLLVRQNAQQRLALSISRICSNSERGLLGAAVDPSFAQNRFIYLYYTWNKFGDCTNSPTRAPVNRVARFTLSPENTVVRGSQVVLVENIPSPNGNHNGGDLQFGKDGLLYVSVGDGGCDYERNSGCKAANDSARGKHTLVGKILRIDRNGDAPASNPFTGAGSVACNKAGRTTAGKSCREIFALGLRNPFRIAMDPNATGTKLFINDVGQSAREEIDFGEAGANYGWNLREGACATGSNNACGTPPAGLTDPIFDYAHSSSGDFSDCRSLAGGAFVPDGVWPASFDGGYLFADFVCGKIFMLENGAGGYAASTFVSDLGPYSIVHMTFGPSGELYYTTYAGGGQVRRISYTAP